MSQNYYPTLAASPAIRFLITLLLPFFYLAQSASAQTLPPNIDFGSGNFTNWICWVGISTRGTVATGCFFDSATVSSPIGGGAPGQYLTGRSRHYVTSGSDTDFYGGFPIVCPTGGTYSLRLGTDSPNLRADRVQYYVHVPVGTTSFNLQCQYAAVLQDGFHMPDEQSTFQVVAYDSATGVVVPAANNLYIARYAVPGFSTSRQPAPADTTITYLPWTPTTINLSGMGGKTIIVECTALDCMWGGHFGYGYFDVVSAADSLMPSIIRYSPAGDSLLVQGPPGYMNYRWYSEDFSQALNSATDTARTRYLPVPAKSQRYNLVIVPFASIGVPDTIQTARIKGFDLGIKATISAVANVYPNPASNLLHLDFRAPFTGTLSLYGPTGQCVYTQELSRQMTQQMRIDRFPAGIYMLTLKDADGTARTQQVVIQR